MTEPGSDLTEGQRWFLGARQRLCAPERDRAEAAEAERDMLRQRVAVMHQALTYIASPTMMPTTDATLNNCIGQARAALVNETTSD